MCLRYLNSSCISDKNKTTKQKQTPKPKLSKDNNLEVDNSLSIFWGIPILNMREAGLKINGINRMTEWTEKTKDPTICCLQEAHFTFKDTHRLKMKG